ncbi:hypothetical protein WJ03_22900 [Burkholderia vietnamiensis]|nr:hypothetical protein WJ03_22900 [Burkholderia vietnamiensis]
MELNEDGKIILEVRSHHDEIVNQPFAPPLYGTELEWNFYFDETNNVRKLYLKEGGTNAEYKNFVLGGIVYQHSYALDNADELIKALVLQKSATEIKLNQIASGPFLGMLNSKRLRTLLRWLIDNNIHIHYTNFSTKYWSIIDIIESIWLDEWAIKYAYRQWEIKDKLFNLANKNWKKFEKILWKYHYPNVGRHEGTSFMTEVAEYLETSITTPASEVERLLVALIRHGATMDELGFLVDNPDDVLVEDFSHLFLRPLYIFPKSKHIFDDEFEVRDKLEKFDIRFDGNAVEYSFSKSTEKIGIQISDVICGFLGVYFNFLEDSSIESLRLAKKNLNPSQRETMSLLKQLIDISDEKSNGFIHRTTATSNDEKNRFFLFDLTW